MSKAGARPVAQLTAATDPEQRATLLQKVIQLSTAVTLIFAAMSPVIYFAGRAYHDGWYSYLHLDAGLFPLDTAGTLTEGTLALAEGLAKLFVAIGKEIALHWFLLLIMIITGGLIWAAFSWLGRRLEEAGKRTNENSDGSKPQPHRRVAIVVLPMLMLVLFGFGFYEAIFGFAMVIGVVSQPFYQLGRYEAKTEVANNFQGSPTVSLKSPKGDLLQTKEISCGPQFCALWQGDHTNTVPLPVITWSESPPPDDASTTTAPNKGTAPAAAVPSSR